MVSQQNLNIGAVFLDLTAAYDTVWHTGLLYKLSKSMPYWFTRLVGLLSCVLAKHSKSYFVAKFRLRNILTYCFYLPIKGEKLNKSRSLSQLWRWQNLACQLADLYYFTKT